MRALTFHVGVETNDTEDEVWRRVAVLFVNNMILATSDPGVYIHDEDDAEAWATSWLIESFTKKEKT